MHTNIHSFKR